MTTTEQVRCPKCGSACWDNRATKRNPKAPDFKCRVATCDGVVWPPKPGEAPATPAPAANGKQGFSAGPHIPAIDGPARVEGLDKIFTVYSASYALAAKLAREEFGADTSDTAVAAMTAALLIAAQKSGLC